MWLNGVDAFKTCMPPASYKEKFKVLGRKTHQESRKTFLSEKQESMQHSKPHNKRQHERIYEKLGV